MVASVHPHIRGAYGCIRLADKENLRFIPTYVGHTLLFRQRSMFSRFIPTYVGHTRDTGSQSPILAVHPHIRGAYSTLFHVPAMGCGSSPHTWGIHYMPYLPILLYRFIPTYVGHTGVKTIWQEQLTVHPHIRGAYSISEVSTLQTSGSSPHTWGILRPAAPVPGPARFIPTYVGHTAPGGEMCAGNRFIPTYVGHTERAFDEENKNDGSSPHTWGIPARPPQEGRIPRFIPTYVGHTPDRRKKNGWFQPLLL